MNADELLLGAPLAAAAAVADAPLQRPSLRECFRFCERKLALMENTLPEFVKSGRITQEAAAHDMACLKEVTRHMETVYLLNE